MKHILFIAIILSTGSTSLFISCNNPDTPEPVIPIDSTTIKPEIKISYEILDSGWVQFYNYTENEKDSKWITIWGGVSSNYKKNPKIWFPDGETSIEFRTYSIYNRGADTTFSIKISNSISQFDTERFIKGVIFGDLIDTTYNRFIHNSPYNGSLFPDDKFPSAVARPTSISYIEVDDLNEVPGRDIETMRNVFKKGPATLAKFTTSSHENGNWSIGRQTSPGWRVIVYHNYAIPGMKISLSGGLAENESLEILDVKEVYQAPVFPCLASTAFIVTFRFKAKTFGQPINGANDTIIPRIPGIDEIDLTFDIKYNMYPQFGECY